MVYPDSGKISRVPPYSRNNLRDASISPTGPLPSLADLSSVLRLSRHFITRSLSCRRNMVVLTTPSMQRLQPITHRWFRLFPFRSPLLRESLLISLPPGTEMFQFSGFASVPYEFRYGYRRNGGFPHSDIAGSQPVCRLPRAFRRLPRPSSPLTA